MSPVQFLPEARADLQDIHRFTRRHFGRAQADVYVTHISQICSLISDGYPGSRNESATQPGLFSHRVRAHRAFFRRGPDGGLVVVRILHDAMNFEDHL